MNDLGRIVKLKDLISKPELNNKYAVIENFVSETNKYQVKILNSDMKSFLVNLEKFEFIYPRALNTISESSTRPYETTWSEYYTRIVTKIPPYPKFDIVHIPEGEIRVDETVPFIFPCLLRGYPPQSTSPKDKYGHFLPKTCIYANAFIRLRNNNDVIEFEDIDFGSYHYDQALISCHKGIAIFRRCRFTNPNHVALTAIGLTENDTVKVLFENCIFETNIIVDNRANISLIHCLVKKCTPYAGIQVQNCGQATINYSLIENCDIGVKAVNGSHLVITNSLIEGCKCGISGVNKASMMEIYSTNISKCSDSAIEIRENCRAIIKTCIINEVNLIGVHVMTGGALQIEDCTIKKCNAGLAISNGKCSVTVINCSMKNNTTIGIFIAMDVIGEFRLENCTLIGNEKGDHIENNGGEKCKVYVDGGLLPTNGKFSKAVLSDTKISQIVLEKASNDLRLQRAFKNAGFDILSPVCGGCNTPEPEDKKFMKCGRCLNAVYCSTSCQKQAWSEHKTKCAPVR